MDNVYQDEQAAKRAMRVWQTKINASVEKNQIIDEYESNFLKLVDQGVVGAENRLSWLESIENTARNRGMPIVKFSISSQEVLSENNLKQEYRGINVYKSSLMLDAKMGHEGDLFALLNDLKKADGLYSVDKCDIEKTGDIIADVNSLKAVCELGWYTFKGTNVNKGDKNAG
jgi:hypothetical protein